ncbi:MAG: Peptidase (modular protein) [Frankiales bacterium]|nr:Peptidase (modular protein) [Frankiales bacterium]
MSSLDHDRVLDDGSTARRAAAPAAAPAVLPAPRGTRRSTEEKAPVRRTRTAASRKTETPTRSTATATSTPAQGPAPVKRPSPAPRVVAVAEEPVTQVVPVVEPAEGFEPLAVPAPERPGARRSRLHRLVPGTRQRPAVLLAAALVGALSVGLFPAETGAMARAAEPAGHTLSVAHALGLTAKGSAAPSTLAAASDLRLLAVSRAQRQAEEAAAAHAQQAADQVAAQAAAQAAAAAAEAARPKAVLPVNGAVLTSGFGMRWGTLHAGIDFAAPIGTPEYAVMDGVVLEAGPASGFGLAVYIQHANGDVTVYGHMEQILVRTGQVVHAGDTVALLGNNGQSTGPHLHLEVHIGGLNGQKVDPVPWLRDRGVQIGTPPVG